MTRLLVAGAGLIGRRYIAQVETHPALDLVGVIDPDPSVRAGLHTLVAAVEGRRSLNITLAIDAVMQPCVHMTQPERAMI